MNGGGVSSLMNLMGLLVDRVVWGCYSHVAMQAKRHTVKTASELTIFGWKGGED